MQNTLQRGEGVSYYECSGKVRSELCVPIVDPVAGTVLGIIDLESWEVSTR